MYVETKLLEYIKQEFTGSTLLHLWRDGDSELYVIAVNSDILFLSVGEFRGKPHHVVEKTIRNGFNKNGIDNSCVKVL